jgi:hypothetical protein
MVPHVELLLDEMGHPLTSPDFSAKAILGGASLEQGWELLEMCYRQARFSPFTRTGDESFLALLVCDFHPFADRGLADRERFGDFIVRPPVAFEFQSAKTPNLAPVGACLL